MESGPAQLRDFAWWSGLGTKDARMGIELVKSNLVKKTEDTKEYWVSPRMRGIPSIQSTAFLLSIYDEYTIAYNDRSVLGGDRWVMRSLQ